MAPRKSSRSRQTVANKHTAIQSTETAEKSSSGSFTRTSPSRHLKLTCTAPATLHTIAKSNKSKPTSAKSQLKAPKAGRVSKPSTTKLNTENLEALAVNTDPSLPMHTYDTRHARHLNRAALTFPFEKLPPELRNKIYGYLLSTPSDIIAIRAGNQLTTSGGVPRAVVRAGLHLQILYLNKAIYAEATSFLYGSKTFFFYMINSHRSMLEIKDFFFRLQELARGAVRMLYIHVDRRNIESLGWGSLCVYLTEEMSLKQLCLVVEDCCFPCNKECPSDLSCLGLPWAKALSQIKGLESFSLHTAGCSRNESCGFRDDGIFKEANVEDHEDSDSDDGHEDWDSDTSFDENVLTTGFDGDDYLPCGCHLYKECCNECFKRDFVEGLRMKMGLKTGERYVPAAKGRYLGCYRNVDPASVKVPAARDVKGLSSYCLDSETELDTEADEDEAEEQEDENTEGLESEEQEADDEEDEERDPDDKEYEAEDEIERADNDEEYDAEDEMDGERDD